jgi:hypothetical protein
MADMAPDTAHSSAITDHPFIAPPGEPWERCITQTHAPISPSGMPGKWHPCGLARSAHVAELEPYAPAGTYRCPFCVEWGIRVCEHGPKGALGLDGEPL